MKKNKLTIQYKLDERDVGFEDALIDFLRTEGFEYADDSEEEDESIKFEFDKVE